MIQKMVPVLMMILVVSAIIGIFPHPASAKIVWSSTFNCGEWKQSDGLSESTMNCDTLAGYGSWTCPGTEDQITSVANYSGGGGGKGYRFWKHDGTNINGGGFALYLKKAVGAPQPEFWMRWYMRYQQGFAWKDFQYDKWMRIHTSDDAPGVVIPEWKYSSSTNISVGGVNYQGGSGTGWQAVMGSSTGDGKWHAYEIHVKKASSGSNGIVQAWIDGNLKLSFTNVDTQSAQAYDLITIGSNQKDPGNGGCAYVDFDDVALSLNGPIGPLGNPAPADVTPPLVPSNPQVQ